MITPKLFLIFILIIVRINNSLICSLFSVKNKAKQANCNLRKANGIFKLFLLSQTFKKQRTLFFDNHKLTQHYTMKWLTSDKQLNESLFLFSSIAIGVLHHDHRGGAQRCTINLPVVMKSSMLLYLIRSKKASAFTTF